jgi:DNA helicase-2/ATP-dependent DNA helicase PcrA
MTNDYSNVKFLPSKSESPRIAQPNVYQRDAIISTDPAIMVVAGPGSGKTRVMAARLAYILQSGLGAPAECLVITFTKSAALNLLKKTREICQKSTIGVSCNTFHSFCYAVIQENLDLVMGNSKKGFTVAKDEDQEKMIMSLMEAKGWNPGLPEVKNILEKIRFWKELGLGYSGIRKNSLLTHNEKRAYDLFPSYQSKLKSLSALDFGDLLLNTLQLFRQHPEVLDRYRSRFKHVLVDEFQDVSPAQYDILRMLVLGSSSGFDVGRGSEYGPESGGKKVI